MKTFNYFKYQKVNKNIKVMDKLAWNEENLIQLGDIFLKQVLRNMADDNTSVVCFGITGKKYKSPNYQIYSDGSSRAFNGCSHELFKFPTNTDRKNFHKENISEPFAYEYIRTLSVPKSTYEQNDDTSFFPEEVQNNKEYYEGSTKKISVNVYERNSEARQKCIKSHGTNCCICGFNFEERYGEMGIGFIHVHHLKPLSEIGKKYKLNPIQDLCPVCPNCHTMLHKRKPPYSIEELIKIINTQSKMSE
ncbi:HNH endonuclease [Candidatus Halobeggiatoa sp. HSG11]|nr:HNH endonuclease [Candidatus Halobeggiatoa sp. HSG11]